MFKLGLDQQALLKPTLKLEVLIWLPQYPNNSLCFLHGRATSGRSKERPLGNQWMEHVSQARLARIEGCLWEVQVALMAIVSSHTHDELTVSAM